MRIGVDVACSVCDHHKTLHPPVDLRPARPRSMAIELNRVISADPNDILEQINIGPPQITYDGPLAQRDSRELLSEMIKSVPTNGRILDLGCGPRDQAKPIEYLGYRYVGVDYSNPSADLLADAHSIPFSDNSFDCVFSYAVLEHLHSPFMAIREIERVLRPGGLFIGTVSQGEPFHASYFHHTTWGLVSLAHRRPQCGCHACGAVPEPCDRSRPWADTRGSLGFVSRSGPDRRMGALVGATPPSMVA